MKLSFGTTTFGKTLKDVPGFAKAQRFIILSEVTSNSIPNILDLFFGLFPGGTDYLLDNSRRTRVMVINTSEVYGSYHGISDTRTRNVYIHHGMAQCKLDEIQGETPVIFTDMDWNVISDCPDSIMIGKKNGRSYNEVGEVNVSYDSAISGDTLFRQGNRSTEILIPSPEFYDEKDMVLIGDREENYYEKIVDNKENMYTMAEDEYINTLYTLKLNDLIDQNTRICKLNIKIENLSSSGFKHDKNIEDDISEICSKVKYALEKYGFSSGEIILDGRNGYNVTNVKSYLNLSKIEQHIDYMSLCSEIDIINDVLLDDLNNCSIIMTVNHANVNVKIIEKCKIFGSNDGQTMTDSNVLELSNLLKSDIQYDFN